jgi:hypothetical protein
MSSFICSDKHFATIAKALFIHNKHQQQNFADTLKRENIRSVNHRYGEKNRFRAVDLSVVTNDVLKDFTHHDLLRLLECVDYQSCDAPDYDDTMMVVTQRMLIAQGAVSNKAQPNLWSI